MSFDWNLSSDEEDLETWTRKEGFLGSENGESTANRAADKEVAPPAVPFASGPARKGYSSSDEDDDIDWENADDDDNGQLEEDKKPAAAETCSRQVTIDLGRREEDRPRKKIKKRRTHRKFRLEALPENIQSLLCDLHRSHLMLLTSRAVFASSMCSDSAVLAVAHSLIPSDWSLKDYVRGTTGRVAPTFTELESLCRWFYDRVHNTESLRRSQRRANVAAGAPVPRSRKVRSSIPRANPDALELGDTSLSSTRRILEYASFLSPVEDADPQLGLRESAGMRWNAADAVQLFIAMARSMGWRCRYVQGMDPMPPELTVDHPLLKSCGDLFSALRGDRKSKRPKLTDDVVEDAPEGLSVGWVEVLCFDPKASKERSFKWIHVDPSLRLFNEPAKVEARVKSKDASRKQCGLPYVLAAEHRTGLHKSGQEFTVFRLADVTPRYAQSWVEALKRRGVIRSKKTAIDEALRESWWSKTLLQLNDEQRCSEYDDANGDRQKLTDKGKDLDNAIVLDGSDGGDDDTQEDDLDDHESNELLELGKNEAIPTSKAAFSTHPLYVLPSLLGAAEVLVPDASKQICGVFKGELVYRRSVVSTALAEKKWLYEGRKVKADQLRKPIKRVKARKKPQGKGFKALTSYGVGNSNDGSEERRSQDIADAETSLGDGKVDLYAVWQTKKWSPPPVGPTDTIPINKYGNVELELLNPGLVHVDVQGAAGVAKRLDIPYAPCLLGFEGHGGNRTPTIRGIVVHAHNEELLREAHSEVASHARAAAEESRRQVVLRRWKKLMVGLLTKERIEREYK